MSLSSLLLRSQSSKSGPQIDSDLDAIFQSSASVFQPSSTTIGSSRDTRVKRKPDRSSQVDTEDGRRTVKKKRTQLGSLSSLVSNGKTVTGTEKVSNSKPLGMKKPKKTRKREDASQNDSHYSASLAGKNSITGDGSGDTDVDGDASQLVHESVSAKKKGAGGGKLHVKFSPPDETPEKRDARTIFIGNLPLEIAQKRPLLKRLRHHILARLETAKIESIRFRSIPFQKPTTRLPISDESDSAAKRKTASDSASTKTLRAHDRERISSWRENQGDNDDKGEQKTFLTPQQKRKIAYINQEFHSDADSVNAYVVFAHPTPPESRASNLPPPSPTMDPYDAARLTVEKCDGTVFMERRIRVDHVIKNDKNDKGGSGNGDAKLSVFVGNLDFASKEDDLRVFFEGIISMERGPVMGEGSSGDGVDSNKASTWVTRVRIVRDKDTQLGKGFAYIQFADRECVDEVLSLDAAKLKFSKRTLRVQRCKNIPGGPTVSQSSSSVKQTSSSARSLLPPAVPKGDPTLGEKLVHLSKDDRKKYKATDPDRVARRLAKKKARMALEKNGLKPRVKDRERVRKSSTAKKGLTDMQKERKHRVRSEKSLAKRNTKK